MSDFVWLALVAMALITAWCLSAGAVYASCRMLHRPLRRHAWWRIALGLSLLGVIGGFLALAGFIRSPWLVGALSLVQAAFIAWSVRRWSVASRWRSAGIAALSCVIVVVVCVAWVWVITSSLARTYKVASPSMLPTLDVSEGVAVDCTGRSPARWDMVVFGLPTDPTNLNVKRVVGLPGERVEIRDGGLVINSVSMAMPAEMRGAPIQSPAPGLSEWGGPDRPLQLQRDEYYLLGDNSARSLDSRRFGAVHFRLIHGVVRARYGSWGRLAIFPTH